MGPLVVVPGGQLPLPGGHLGGDRVHLSKLVAIRSGHDARRFNLVHEHAVD